MDRLLGRRPALGNSTIVLTAEVVVQRMKRGGVENALHYFLESPEFAAKPASMSVKALPLKVAKDAASGPRFPIHTP